MFSIIRPFIFNLDPEMAHDLAIKSLKLNLIPNNIFQIKDEDKLETKVFGQKIRNPIGLAAGFDKSAEVYNSFFKLGFGFVEVGTITPRRQLGNPKPRVFRLEKDRALINRLGFNNHGLDLIIKRISKNPPKEMLGINIGPNSDTKDKSDDFVECLSKIHKFANYLTINISSPNTAGLRDFHEKKSLDFLLNKIFKLKIPKPICLKISPDIDYKDVSQIIELVKKFNINGLIISNTTIENREELKDTKKSEEGGLSGQPLKHVSTKMIKEFYKGTNKKITIIGVGGVDSGESAFEKISAGASAIQLYTGMIFRGPTIARDIKNELISILKRENIKNVSDAVGLNT